MKNIENLSRDRSLCVCVFLKNQMEIIDWKNIITEIEYIFQLGQPLQENPEEQLKDYHLISLATF